MAVYLLELTVNLSVLIKNIVDTFVECAQQRRCYFASDNMYIRADSDDSNGNDRAIGISATGRINQARLISMDPSIDPSSSSIRKSLVFSGHLTRGARIHRRYVNSVRAPPAALIERGNREKQKLAGIALRCQALAVYIEGWNWQHWQSLLQQHLRDNGPPRCSLRHRFDLVHRAKGLRLRPFPRANAHTHVCVCLFVHSANEA